MKYKLIIAEKPSVARNIAAVMGANKKHEGFSEGNGYYVSWCVGHLVGMAPAAAYNEAYAKWDMKDLPIVPQEWIFEVNPERYKQFSILRELMLRKDVIEVINACDAGREGELIFRLVYDLAKCTKPITRLWISSLEDDTIRKGFRNLHPGSDFDGLHQAALCRLKADWLVGINATRYFSLLYGQTLNIGRVVTPTLAMLVQRESEINAFEAKPFYVVHLDCGFPAVSERIEEKSIADQFAEECKWKNAKVKSIEYKEKCENAPALYDLTTLQRDANRFLGYTAQQTLDYLQSLYEKRLCTYPRTDSRFLTDDMVSLIPAVVSAAAMICLEDSPDIIFGDQICNSKKVSDHHAIIPTIGAGEVDLLSLPQGERDILTLVAERLLSSVKEAHRYAETTVLLECVDHIFTAKDKVVLIHGWKKTKEEHDDRSSVLSDLSEGDDVPIVDVSVKAGKTSSPCRFTEDALLSAMESVGGKDLPKDAERKGIGTPATRAGIIEKLISIGFVERKKVGKSTYLLPTPVGSALITVLPEQLQSAQLTAEWEHYLKQIEQGELSSDHFLDEITAMLNQMILEYAPVSGTEILFPTDSESVGVCPRCGHPVVKRQKGYFCSNSDCRFALWKNNRFFESKKKPLTDDMVRSLLKDGRIPLKGCYSETSGKTYDAIAVLTDDGQQIGFVLEFV